MSCSTSQIRMSTAAVVARATQPLCSVSAATSTPSSSSSCAARWLYSHRSYATAGIGAPASASRNRVSPSLARTSAGACSNLAQGPTVFDATRATSGRARFRSPPTALYSAAHLHGYSREQHGEHVRKSRLEFLVNNPKRLFSGVKVEFVYEKDGTRIGPCEPKPHQTFLDVAHDHDIEIEGACGGNAACSTCHVYLRDEDYKRFPEPDEDELDMLDLAAGLKEGVSRLCCQLRVRQFDKGEEETLVLTIPKESNNFFE